MTISISSRNSSSIRIVTLGVPADIIATILFQGGVSDTYIMLCSCRIGKAIRLFCKESRRIFLIFLVVWDYTEETYIRM
jgi:hypothetical protein